MEEKSRVLKLYDDAVAVAKKHCEYNSKMYKEFREFSPFNIEYSNIPQNGFVPDFGMYSSSMILGQYVTNVLPVHKIKLKKNSHKYTVYYLDENQKLKYFFHVRNGEKPYTVFKVIHSENEMLAIEVSDLPNDKFDSMPQVFYRTIHENGLVKRLEYYWTTNFSYNAEEYIYNENVTKFVNIIRIGQHDAVKVYCFDLTDGMINLSDKKILLREFLTENDFTARGFRYQDFAHVYKNKVPE